MFGVSTGDPHPRVLPKRSGVLDLVCGEQDDVDFRTESRYRVAPLPVLVVRVEKELGDANWEMYTVLRGLLDDESPTMVRDGLGGEQQTFFAIDAKHVFAHTGQLE